MARVSYNKSAATKEKRDKAKVTKAQIGFYTYIRSRPTKKGTNGNDRIQIHKTDKKRTQQRISNICKK